MEDPPNYKEGISALEKGEEALTADSQEPKSAPIFVSPDHDVKTAEQPRWDQQTVQLQQLDEAPTETYVYIMQRCYT